MRECIRNTRYEVRLYVSAIVSAVITSTILFLLPVVSMFSAITFAVFAISLVLYIPFVIERKKAECVKRIASEMGTDDPSLTEKIDRIVIDNDLRFWINDRKKMDIIKDKLAE